MNDRFYDWVIRKTQENPGRTIAIGFIPAMIFVGHQMVTSIIDFPWMAIFYVPMVAAIVMVVYMLSKLANLNARLDAKARLERDAGSTSDQHNEG